MRADRPPLSLIPIAIGRNQGCNEHWEGNAHETFSGGEQREAVRNEWVLSHSLRASPSFSPAALKGMFPGGSARAQDREATRYDIHRRASYMARQDDRSRTAACPTAPIGSGLALKKLVQAPI